MLKKKITSKILAILLSSLMFSSCGQIKTAPQNAKSSSQMVSPSMAPSESIVYDQFSLKYSNSTEVDDGQSLGNV